MIEYTRSIFFAIAVGAVSACGKSEKTAPEPAISAGEQVFIKNCKVCHAQGINGAPVVGNKKMWAPRIAQGEDVLFEHATNGYGLMPARAGKADLSDEDIKLAIQYMISQVEE